MESRRRSRWAFAGRYWKLLLEGSAWLVWSTFQLRLMAFQRLAPQLGGWMVETSRETPPAAEKTIRDIRLVVRVAANKMPWDASCLVRAMAARRMLYRRGLPWTLYLGVSRQGRPLEAHAWLRSGRLYVTGQQKAADYSVVSYFGSANGDAQARR